MNTNIIPLPDNALDFALAYTLKRTSTLNDQVEQLVRKLIADAEFRKFIDAVSDEDSQEGKMYLDDVAAAMMLRAFAKDNGEPVLVMDAKLATLIRSLKVVLRRFNAGRDQRIGLE